MASTWMLLNHGEDQLEDLRHVTIHVFDAADSEPSEEELQSAMVSLLGNGRPPSEQLRQARLTLVSLDNASYLGYWHGELRYTLKAK